MSRPEPPSAGVVVAGHGEFATGLASAVEVIIGPQAAFRAVALAEHDSPERFGVYLLAAVEDVDRGAGVLVLTDLPGATPFSAAARVAHERPGVEVVSGANLPMLLEALTQRDGQTLDATTTTAADAGALGIRRWAPPA
ncbi:PTS sugar transporter subunit IIA [Pseudonocardia acaciae]|uniref:PTS sugar transporter subunit IIA n=1 Tax=Pseudonocardia acaciae TaxID=551276 RepID=UPI00048A5468|nr:PTS sugar transporter subunit IIA [Pseudonocardia acaciae]